MTDAFQIPHLTTDLDPCRPSGEFTLHLPTLQENLVTVLVDVILSIAWKRVYLEFSHGFGKLRVPHSTKYICPFKMDRPRKVM